jgi:hypothetical protein
VGGLVFIRFVVERLDAGSGRRQGLFQAAEELQRSDNLTTKDNEHLEVLLKWFSRHLKKPTRLSLSSRPHRKPQAISWFKAAATLHISKMREFQTILERNGIHVEIVTTARPGYIVYEDRFQVAAYPFAETPT